MDQLCEICNLPIKSAKNYEEFEKGYAHLDCFWKAKLVAFLEGVGMQRIDELIEKKPSELRMIGSFLADKIEKSVRAAEK